MSLGNNLCAKFPPNKIRIVCTIQGAVMDNEDSQMERHSTKRNEIDWENLRFKCFKVRTKIGFLSLSFFAWIWFLWTGNIMRKIRISDMNNVKISIDRNLLIQRNHNVT